MADYRSDTPSKRQLPADELVEDLIEKNVSWWYNESHCRGEMRELGIPDDADAPKICMGDLYRIRHALRSETSAPVDHNAIIDMPTDLVERTRAVLHAGTPAQQYVGMEIDYLLAGHRSLKNPAPHGLSLPVCEEHSASPEPAAAGPVQESWEGYLHEPADAGPAPVSAIQEPPMDNDRGDMAAVWDAIRHALDDVHGDTTWILEGPSGKAAAVRKIKELGRQASAQSASVAIDLGRYVNAADISAADMPHVVVEKLQKAINAASPHRKTGGDHG